MFDVHCHILPGMDDGPTTIDESIEMARKAVSEGITKVVATPHHRNGRYENDRRVIMQEVTILNKELSREGIDLEVLPGQEIALSGEVLEDYEKSNLLTVNDAEIYLFVELPASHLPAYTNKLFFDLQMKGLIPVIVHPERNQEIIENPKKLYQLVKEGALSQVTASAVSGEMGKKMKKFSHELISHNLAHVIASDAHNTTTRPFHLRKAFDTVEEKLGMGIRYRLQENAELMVNAKMVDKEMPQRIHKKKRLGIF
ncbi:tyrosine-protein phosphatase [Pseudalkalibacillus sp. JSM 102089]|uniref:tyrosine-protein phosphatase n=1 Tax=Pseudalkalibacillus sp. JSM 102089 TaxID=3229856 RepID=UPI00352693C3